MRERPHESRASIIASVRDRFIARGYPRAQFLLILASAGAAAFIFSAASLREGFNHMGLRYLAATIVGYLTFLALIRVWIALQRSAWRVELDLPGVGDGWSGGSSAGPKGGLFAGGRSGGGGGGGGWGSSRGSSRGGGLGWGDADELWPLVLAGVLAAAVIATLLYTLSIAPMLLAEVALDAALVTGVYRRLRREDARHWLASVLRRTWLPALGIGTALFFIGLVLQRAAPAAQSIGPALRALGVGDGA